LIWSSQITIGLSPPDQKTCDQKRDHLKQRRCHQ
jgi:hypothetical protein